jgi:hypothetical protein
MRGYEKEGGKALATSSKGRAYWQLAIEERNQRLNFKFNNSTAIQLPIVNGTAMQLPIANGTIYITT